MNEGISGPVEPRVCAPGLFSVQTMSSRQSLSDMVLRFYVDRVDR